MTLTKARLCSCDVKGTLDTGGTSFYVQFNPNAITIHENVGGLSDNFSRSAGGKFDHTGLSTGIKDAQKRRRGGLVLAAELFFNTFEGQSDFGDVRAVIAPLYGFFNSAGAERGKLANYVSFSWSSLQVHGLLSSMECKYTMFAHNGTPVRATVSIEITGDYTRKNQDKGKAMDAEAELGGWPFADFSAALAAYSDTCVMKAAARSAGITNIRTGS